MLQLPGEQVVCSTDKGNDNGTPLPLLLFLPNVVLPCLCKRNDHGALAFVFALFCVLPFISYVFIFCFPPCIDDISTGGSCVEHDIRIGWENVSGENVTLDGWYIFLHRYEHAPFPSFLFHDVNGFVPIILCM
jgi:hypothetical protein